MGLENLMGDMFSLEGELEAAGPKPSPGFKVKVIWRNPDLPFGESPGGSRGSLKRESWLVLKYGLLILGVMTSFLQVTSCGK